MPDMLPQALGGTLMKVYRTAPVDSASLDSEAVKGKVKVAVPQFDPQGNLVRLKEGEVGNATVIRSTNDADREKPYIWISAAPERVQVPGGAVEHYGDYRVPAATVKKILGQEEELSYPDFVERSTLQTYSDVVGYLDTLKAALAEGGSDNRWVVVMADDAQVVDAEAIHQALRDAPLNAGMLHLAGANKYGGFGELPISVDGSDDLVEPTRLYGAERATAFRADVLPAVIEALEANLRQVPLQVVVGENAEKPRGGISPLDHVFALLQRSAALRVELDRLHPEDGAMLKAFRDTMGERDAHIYAMNPPAVIEAGKQAPHSVRPIERRIARETRKLVHGLQMGGNAAAIRAIDPLVKCSVDQTAGQWLPAQAMLAMVKEINRMAGHKEALAVAEELVKKRFSAPAEGLTPLAPQGLAESIRCIADVAEREGVLGDIKGAIKNEQLNPTQLQAHIRELHRDAMQAMPGRAAGGETRGR